MSIQEPRQERLRRRLDSLAKKTDRAYRRVMDNDSPTRETQHWWDTARAIHEEMVAIARRLGKV